MSEKMKIFDILFYSRRIVEPRYTSFLALELLNNKWHHSHFNRRETIPVDWPH